MKILIVTPAPARQLTGNRITALRWRRILRELGHQTRIARDFVPRSPTADPDLLIALHARRSYDSIERFHVAHPDRPLIVALTGTDLYNDLDRSAKARRSITMADRLVVLQAEALDRLDARVRRKTRVVHQSALPMPSSIRKRVRTFDVCVVGHLRPVKDPFRAALAARRLPFESRIRILHLGAALSAAMRHRAEREMTTNPRYRWLGALPHWQARRRMAGSRLLVLSSRLEGGANVVSEALVAGLPVLASRIPGSIGMLGDDHPGFFEVGDTAGLATLLSRAESEPRFLRELANRSRRLAARFTPEREAVAWRSLLANLERPGRSLR